jgi:hypothetical protein
VKHSKLLNCALFSPGSFLVRPSERVPGDCALAFRTRTEIRHWRIVKKSNKYYVHPRPNPYNSVADIIKVILFTPSALIFPGIIYSKFN